MNRVLVRAWPDAEESRREALGRTLADDVNWQHSEDHLRRVYADALEIARLVREGVLARDAGRRMTPEAVAESLKILVRVYQIAGAERYDEVNGATAIAAGCAAGAFIVPLCAGLVGYEFDYASATSATALVGSVVLSTAASVTAGIYGFRGNVDAGRRLWSLPGMATLARLWPGSNPLFLFWDVVDKQLEGLADWRTLTPGDELRPNQHLDAFVKLLSTLAPGEYLNQTCAGLLDSVAPR